MCTKLNIDVCLIFIVFPPVLHDILDILINFQLLYSDLRQIIGILHVLHFRPPIKLIITIELNIVEVDLDTHISIDYHTATSGFRYFELWREFYNFQI